MDSNEDNFFAEKQLKKMINFIQHDARQRKRHIEDKTDDEINSKETLDYKEGIKEIQNKLFKFGKVQKTKQTITLSRDSLKNKLDVIN
jgi:vacuolar-type H+-ATPase subunit E/Vma4